MKIALTGKTDCFEASVMLANRLDPAIASFRGLEYAECMENMSGVVRKVLLKQASPQELSTIVAHLLEHVVPIINRNAQCWGDFWNAAAWNAFSSLVTSLVPKISLKERIQAIHHVACCLVTLEDGAANPKLLHFHEDLESSYDKSRAFSELEQLSSFEPKLTRLLNSLGLQVI